jgi:hypothetical protein
VKSSTYSFVRGRTVEGHVTSRHADVFRKHPVDVASPPIPIPAFAIDDTAPIPLPIEPERTIRDQSTDWDELTDVDYPIDVLNRPDNFDPPPDPRATTVRLLAPRTITQPYLHSPTTVACHATVDCPIKVILP